MAVVAALTVGTSIGNGQGAERRVALVIGNGQYQFSNTLRNPVNDATDMAAALERDGFSVTVLTDAGRVAMEKAVRDFGATLRDADAVGLFYYSGHGAQTEGQNYLLPVDADIQDADELRYRAVDAESVLAKMRSAGNKLNIVVLDACRNNPFPGTSRAAVKGLSAVTVKVPESVIVYATDPGSTAADGAGRNSPFTAAFLASMEEPGLDITLVMKRVTSRVREETGGAQTPWVSTNLTRDFSFRPAVRLPAPRGLVPVKGGVFQMGSDMGTAEARPVHQVRVSDFLIGRYEVTVGEFQEFVAATAYRTEGERVEGAYVLTGGGWTTKRDASWKNPYFTQGEDNPVTCVTWNDAVEYCNWRSKREGLRAAYTISGTDSLVSCDFGANGYRLPTEAEWEYAARGGAQSAEYVYAGSTDLNAVAWNGNNAGQSTHGVGTRAPNELGLYDMSGNAMEWCWDLYGNYASGTQTDPEGADSGPYRVARGGSWFHRADSVDTDYFRVAARVHGDADYRSIVMGFRLVRTY